MRVRKTDWNILVNLSEGFFTRPELADIWDRIDRLGHARQASHNSADEIRPDLVGADAVILWSWPNLTEDLLDAAARLKYRGHLDISQGAARIALAREVPVSVSRGGFSPAVSEMVLALILNTLRGVSDYHAQMRSGEETWVRRFPADIPRLERELTGLAVGIVGLGRVGQRLAELLAPFRCVLRVFDPYVSEEALTSARARRTSLKEMIIESDVVVLCAASNPGTRSLIGREELAWFRPDAVLVNAARAALVDTAALMDRLQRGDLIAAVDVFDQEPLARDSPLRTLPNLYLTPHRAGGVIASARRILTYLIDDLEAVMEGRERRYSLTEAMLPGLDA